MEPESFNLIKKYEEVKAFLKEECRSEINVSGYTYYIMADGSSGIINHKEKTLLGIELNEKVSSKLHEMVCDMTG
jgi:hypothetical protein